MSENVSATIVAPVGGPGTRLDIGETLTTAEAVNSADLPVYALARETDGQTVAAVRLRHVPGTVQVFVFPGFGVVSTPDGACIVPCRRSHAALQAIGRDGLDRVVFPNDENLAAAVAVEDLSLTVWPKGDVP